MKKIFLDTSFLIACAEFKIDIVSELKRICDFPFQIFVFNKIFFELQNLALKKRISKTLLNLVQSALKNLNVQIISTEKKLDEALIEAAEEGAIIATIDKALKKAIKKFGGQTIIVRKKKILAFV